MKEIDLAYVAGIIDGEGCIGLYSNTHKYLNKHREIRPRYCLTVTVCNTNEELIKWFHSLFGGHLHYRKSKEEKWKPQWECKLSANKALDFLKLIYPYLRLKKPQAEIAFRFQERQQGHRLTDQELIIAASEKVLMANLNKRGK